MKYVIFLKPNIFYSFSQDQNEADELAYKLFKRRIIQRSRRVGPAASTPLPSGGRRDPNFEFDTVCQRLELESSPKNHKEAHDVLQKNMKSINQHSYETAIKKILNVSEKQ